MSDVTPPLPRGGNAHKPKLEPGPRRLWLTGQSGADTAGPAAEQFDALTELFLGEIARPRRLVEEPLPEPRKPEPTTKPQLRLAGAEDLDTPPETAPAPARPLAAPMPAAPAPSAARPAFVECLVVGNLPVLASAWASQYVREISDIAGRPIASVRMQAGYATVELVGAPAAEPLPHAAPMDLEAALRWAASRTDRWVLRVDAAEELATAGRAVIRLVTLLTGADESARVSTYSSLKALADKLSAAPVGAHLPAPVIRVAIMSAPKDDAGAAAAKIVETARAKLGRDIQHAICSAKIKAFNSPTLLFNGKTDITPSLLLDLLEKAVGFVPEKDHAAPPASIVEALAPPAPAPAPDPVITTPDPALIIKDLEAETVEAEPVAIAPLAPQPPTEPEPIAAAAPTAPPPTPAALPHQTPIDDLRLWAAGSAQADPKPPQPDAAPSPPALCTHLPGVRSLQLTCPYAKDVQFGIDQSGCMHLLARGHDSDDESTLGRLMAASAWLEAHRPLVTAALGLLPSGPASHLHLFTSHPRRMRRLLDTDVKVHLLAPVMVNGSSGWFCTELN